MMHTCWCPGICPFDDGEELCQAKELATLVTHLGSSIMLHKVSEDDCTLHLQGLSNRGLYIQMSIFPHLDLSGIVHVAFLGMFNPCRGIGEWSE